MVTRIQKPRIEDQFVVYRLKTLYGPVKGEVRAGKPKEILYMYECVMDASKSFSEISSASEWSDGLTTG